jgi:predicted amidohydrolase
MSAPYIAAMCRPATACAFDSGGQILAEVLDANIATFEACIAHAAAEHGAQLVVFPEFALTGYAPVDNAAWVAASITFPGPQADRLAQAARRAGAHVLVQAAERHAAFPGRYFLSAAILTPDGEVGMVHRKNYTLSLRTSPIEVHDRFIEVFGADAFLPVLDTPLGRLGISIAAEVHWPEAVRTLALKGAEVVLNPIANVNGVDYLARPGADAVRAVRAFENCLYLAMTNMAGGEVPPAVYGPTGASIGREADEGLFTLATIDIAALRQLRATAGMNLLAQLQTAIHEDPALPLLWPANLLPASPASGFDELAAAEAAAWHRLCAAGRGQLP